MGRYEIRETEKLSDRKLIEELNAAEFDTPIPEIRQNVLWIARDLDTGKIAGFTTLKPIRKERSVFLSRSLVLPTHRGKRLQRRMIAVRLAWARRNGFECALSYCHFENLPSAMSLLNSGFKLYEPSWKWGGSEMLYFKKNLS